MRCGILWLIAGVAIAVALSMPSVKSEEVSMRQKTVEKLKGDEEIKVQYSDKITGGHYDKVTRKSPILTPPTKPEKKYFSKKFREGKDAFVDGEHFCEIWVVPEAEGILYDPKETKKQMWFGMTYGKKKIGNDYPCRARGNLIPAKDGGGDGGGAVKVLPPDSHWAAALEDVKVVSVTGIIPATPCQTIRSPNKGNPKPREYVSTEDSASWKAGHSIVMIENSVQTINLKGIAQPTGTPLRWTVKRNPNDNAKLKAAPFPAKENLSLSSQEGQTTKLSLDAIGSFSAICYVDINKNDQFDDQIDEAKYFNIVVARVMFQKDDSKAFPKRQVFKEVKGVAGRPTGIYVDGKQRRARVFRHANGEQNWAKLGIQFEIYFNVFGGGPKGILGVERVYSGWCNNVVKYSVKGGYEEQHSSVALVSNADGDVNGIPTGVVNHIVSNNKLPEALNPALGAKHPLLDSIRPNAGTGGKTPCLSGASRNLGWLKGIGVGCQYYCKAGDSTQYLIPVEHPKFILPKLKTFTYDVAFRSYCVLWTGIQAGEPKEPGANLYTVVNERPWSIFAKYSLVWEKDKLKGDPQPDNKNTISIGNNIKQDPVVPMESLTGEVCSPIVVKRIMYEDCTK